MKIRNQVEGILRVSNASRSSDKELLIIYMRKFGIDLSPEQERLFRKMPSVETITRIRRQLQEEDKYPATDKIEQERFNKYYQMKHDTQRDPEQIIEQTPKAISWLEY